MKTRGNLHRPQIEVVLVHFCFLMSCICRTTALRTNSHSSEFSILEEFPAGTVVGGIKENEQLTAEFGDDVLSQLRFTFRYSTMNYRYFAVDEMTGIIRTSRKIDRELLCPSMIMCSLYLDVTVRPVKYFRIIKVMIIIEDINDNAPSFLQSRLTIEIKENTAPGASFSLPSAEDPDSGIFGVQDYQLISTSDKFSLIYKKQYDGLSEVRLNLTDRLDREVKDFYSMIMIAVDGGNPPKSGTIVVDVVVGDANDNNPQFDTSSYEIEVPESLPPGSTIVRIHAVDLDDGLNAMISYSFTDYTDSSHGQLFSINNQTGEIYLKKSLDYEDESSFQLTATATDQGPGSLPAFTKVIIIILDENDNSPQIILNPLTSSGLVEVRENAEPGTFVAYVAVKDADSGKSGDVECTLDTDICQLDSVYGTEYKLKTLVTFDREEKEEYVILMTCSDKGNPIQMSTLEITIYIIDENDNAPVLTKDRFVSRVMEGNSIGNFLLSFNSTDIDVGKNAFLRYELVGDDEQLQSVLSIDSKTGKVYTNVIFDYERMQEYTFLLTVSDSGEVPLSTSASLVLQIIDINDEIPRFEKSFYHFTIIENLPPGSFIGSIAAHDADITPAFSKITYSIPKGNAAIDIDAYTGSLLTAKRIDREQISILEFQAMAYNEGFSSMKSIVNVTVYVEDENDNPPLIQFPNKQNQIVQISSHASVGSFIARISANDPDVGVNAQLIYAIAHGNEDEIFAVDRKTGAVSLVKAFVGGGDKTYWLVVTVKDCGQRELVSAADFIIQVNSSAETNNVSPMTGEISNTLIGDKLMIMTGMICSVIVVLFVVFFVVFFIWRHKRNKNRLKWEQEQYVKKMNLEQNLRRPPSSLFYGSHTSHRSLESRSIQKEMMNDTSGTERDDSDDDNSSHVTAQCLKKELHKQEETYKPPPGVSSRETFSNLRTLDVLPRPASSNSHRPRNRRRPPNYLRTKAIHSRPGSSGSRQISSTRRQQTSKSDNETNKRSGGGGRRGGDLGGSGSEYSGSYFDSGMDHSEESDNRHCVSRSS